MANPFDPAHNVEVQPDARGLLNTAYSDAAKFQDEFRSMSGAEQLQAVRSMVPLNAEDRKAEPSLPILEYTTFDNTFCESSELLNVSLQNVSCQR